MGWLKVTPRTRISPVTAALVVLPGFNVPPLLVGDWKFVKWIAVDAAELKMPCGTVR